MAPEKLLRRMATVTCTWQPVSHRQDDPERRGPDLLRPAPSTYFAVLRLGLGPR